MKRILYYACTTLVLLLFSACTNVPMTRQEASERQERRIRWQLERQLNHQRIVNDCQKYGNCKGNYKQYNKK